MRSVFFICFMALALCAQAAIYKWVDSRGEVHYSDTPTRDAEEIKLSDPTIYSPAGTGSGSASGQVPATVADPLNYSSFVILAPNNNEMVQANDGNVTLRFQTQPELQAGHYIQAVLDGRILDQRATGPVLQLSNLTRGAHMVHASIHDAAGRLLTRSNIVQFFVRQISVIEDGKSPEPPPPAAAAMVAMRPSTSQEQIRTTRATRLMPMFTSPRPSPSPPPLGSPIPPSSPIIRLCFNHVMLF